MTVYLIARMEITDPERFSEYVAEAPTLFAEHGGQYVAGGGAPHRRHQVPRSGRRRGLLQ